ncbi:MAG: hypothetical protein HY238_26185 [Acidobacteria bacterium]|nr:hypothetical protein [Acidobacteriota bacterium]
MFKLFVLAAALTPAQSTDWAKEPNGFRGLKFAASESEAQKLFVELGECNGPKSEERWCHGWFMIGQERVHGTLVFLAGKFVSFISSPLCTQSEEIKRVALMNYGDPTTNSDGVMLWVGSKVTVSLWQCVADPAVRLPKPKRTGRFAVELSSYVKRRDSIIKTIEAEDAKAKSAAEKLR